MIVEEGGEFCHSCIAWHSVELLHSVEWAWCVVRMAWRSHEVLITCMAALSPKHAILVSVRAFCIR